MFKITAADYAFWDTFTERGLSASAAQEASRDTFEAYACADTFADSAGRRAAAGVTVIDPGAIDG